jgi:hypothetical protein
MLLARHGQALPLGAPLGTPCKLSAYHVVVAAGLNSALRCLAAPDQGLIVGPHQKLSVLASPDRKARSELAAALLPSSL